MGSSYTKYPCYFENTPRQLISGLISSLEWKNSIYSLNILRLSNMLTTGLRLRSTFRMAGMEFHTEDEYFPLLNALQGVSKKRIQSEKGLQNGNFYYIQEISLYTLVEDGLLLLLAL